MKYICGLLIGMLLGYVLRRSWLCFTGLIRDAYLMKYYYNAVYFLTMIAVQGAVYYGLGAAGIVRIPSYLPPFSLFSIAVGSFMFGFGAVLAGGCMTKTLVECGDGRILGWIKLLVFMVCAYLVAAGPLIGVSKTIRTIALIDDNLSIRTTMIPLVIFAVLSIVLIISLIRHNKRERMGDDSEEPGSLLSWIIEREWPEELGPVLVGIVLGIAYPVSGAVGRHFGVSITSPIMSYVYAFTRPVETCGGCNPYDEVFGFGSMLVLGIVVGSFLTAIARHEFRIMKPRKSALIKAVIGSALMGVGSMWGLGCLLGNGIVGTAQLSLKSWYALIFLAAGIWTAVRTTLIPLYRN